jgi:hypothetical protein
MFDYAASPQVVPASDGVDNAGVVGVITDAARQQNAMCGRELAAIGVPTNPFDCLPSGLLGSAFGLPTLPLRPASHRSRHTHRLRSGGIFGGISCKTGRCGSPHPMARDGLEPPAGYSCRLAPILAVSRQAYDLLSAV